MAELDKWRDYAAVLNFPRPENAEKDYLQELLLKGIFAFTDDIVFRGGTALSKFYGSGRFSDDLDFVIRKSIDRGDLDRCIKGIKKGINSVGDFFGTKFHEERYREMLEYTIKVSGPLFIASGNEAAIQKLYIDLNTKEMALIKPKVIFRAPIYETIGNYTVIVEDIKELLADKVKALIERHYKGKGAFTRDIYDIWAISEKYNQKIDFGLVKEKMERYGIKRFSVEDFKNALKDAAPIWDKEMSAVMRRFPSYETVNNVVKNL